MNSSESQPLAKETTAHALVSVDDKVLTISARKVIMILRLQLAFSLFALALTHSPAHSPSETPGSGVYQSAAVATDAGVCSEIGASILQSGGSAVDAAVSSLLCVGTVNLHSTGIGGGGFMVFYEDATKQAYAIDYREVAPQGACYNMYEGLDPTASKQGGLSVAVPGELRGLEMAWKRWGKLEWSALFAPVIKLAREGFPVSRTIYEALTIMEPELLSGDYPGLAELLAPNGKILQEGDIIRRPLYADTLEEIANEGVDYFYDSDFTKDMVNELVTEYDSILTVNDFKNYTSLEQDPTVSKYEDTDIFGHPPPSSGAVLGLILNILDNYDFDSDDFGDLYYHRLVEAIKFAYGQRLYLGDPAFNSSVDKVTQFMLSLDTADNMFSRITDDRTHNQDYYLLSPQVGIPAHDHGTSHVSILAENGDAVACTSSINMYFGSLIRSRKNGVIFNDHMDDFSYPTRNDPNGYEQTVPNYIQPGKRPQSSTAPTILIDSNANVQMVVGASGGFLITTAVAQVILDALSFDKTLESSIALKRLHHQLFPNKIKVEKDFPADIQESLRGRGHEIVTSLSFACVQGILVDGDNIYATCDQRKGGSPSGY